jgi:DNA-binding LacI/PurR family transcriptional regulator
MAIYADIMNKLVEEIESGKYPPETMLPSEKDICSRFNASRTSVRNALKTMQLRGYICRRQGSGSFVKQRRVDIQSDIVNIGIVLNYNRQHSVEEFTSNPFFGKKYKGIRDASVTHRANPSLFIYEDDKDIDESIFAGYGIDGFLDIGGTVSERLNRYFVENACNVCSITNSFHVHEYKFDWPLIVNDYLSGVRQAVKFYTQQGLSNFGFFAVAKYGFGNYNLYKSVLNSENADFNINSVVLFPENPRKLAFQEERARYFANNLFSGDNIPEVLFTDGHFVAEELIQYLKETERGRSILKNIRFCVIGDPTVETLNFSEAMDFIVPDSEGIGRLATELLIDSIKNGMSKNEHVYVPSNFVSRKIT